MCDTTYIGEVCQNGMPCYSRLGPEVIDVESSGDEGDRVVDSETLSKSNDDYLSSSCLKTVSGIPQSRDDHCFRTENVTVRRVAKKSCSGVRRKKRKHHVEKSGRPTGRGSSPKRTSFSPRPSSSNLCRSSRTPERLILAGPEHSSTNPLRSSHSPERSTCTSPSAKSSHVRSRLVAKKSCSGFSKNRKGLHKKHNKLSSTLNSRSSPDFKPRKRLAAHVKGKKQCDSRSIPDLERIHKKDTKVKLRTGSKPAKQTFEKPGFIRSHPVMTEEVSDAMEAVVEEMKKPCPSVEKLMVEMRRAFPYRKHLYESIPDIRYMLEMFPALKDWRILKKDFELFKRASFEELSTKLMVELERTYISCASVCISWSDPLLQKTLSLKKSGSETVLRDIKLLCFAYVKMEGKIKGALYKQHQKGETPFKRATPTIDITGDYGSDDVEFAIFCEETKITEAPNFYEAVMSVYAIYWIFNLCYENRCKSFFESFDALIGE